MADHVGLVPGKCVEDSTGIGDVCRNRVRPDRRRRSQPPLLVPRHVVLLCQLFRELAEIVEAEAGPAVQQEDPRPATGTEAGDARLRRLAS